jgi:D-beta-D-heptose 7-phosphate kinase / D-beta-D-heptose 1-phosphate adenosyltransferase
VSSGPLVIVGDALLDRDVDGRADRLCPDAPAPVVEEATSRARPGGAALAALLAAREVVLIAPLGDDPASKAVLETLPDAVTVIPLPLTGPLPEKTRIRVDGRTLLRVDNPAGSPGRAGRRAAAVIKSAGAVLVSDYGRGTTADATLRDALATRAGQAPVIWDPHPRGAAPVPGTLLATPNEAEAAAAAGGRAGALRDAATAAGQLLDRWPAQAVAVTLGARGALLTRRGQAPLAVPATPVPAIDPCGAGDRFAVATAAALCDGAVLSEAVTWAVTAAGRYLADGGVSRLGEAGRADAPETGTANTGADIAAPTAGDGTSEVVTRATADGVLVAAGGCFDMLHAGHVAMLRAARALGDTLVVCMNSDESVRRLKGPGRPINPAADRAAVLRALDCVERVLIFDEDTPERLLAELRPDIWVKGGDYDGRELPEAAVLRRWGGLAVTVPYLDGRSTTRIASAAAALTLRDQGRRGLSRRGQRIRVTTRQASSPVSDAALTSSRSAWAAASGPAGMDAATSSRSASLIESARRSISPSVNITRKSPIRSWTSASSYSASGSRPSSTPPGSGSVEAWPSRASTGGRWPARAQRSTRVSGWYSPQTTVPAMPSVR